LGTRPSFSNIIRACRFWQVRPSWIAIPSVSGG